MRYIYTVFLILSSYCLSFAQGDDCSSATLLTASGSCSPVSGTSAGASQSFSGCNGTADDDVWYKFVATATTHSIIVTASSSYDPVVELFSGTCGASSLVSLSCMDATNTGQQESINMTGLTIGTTYFIRVFHYFSGSGSGSFSICVTAPAAPPVPVNDNCAGAINLTVNSSCTSTSGSGSGATPSMVGCTGTADDDVWYKFTANSFTQAITVTGSASMDPVVELFSGSSCSSLSSLYCKDVTFSGGTETINAVGLSIGQVYYVRVYDYYSGGGYPFSICVIGTPIGSTLPNDDPCSAISLPPVTSSCNYLRFFSNGATNTGIGLAPAPVSCVGGAGAYTSSDKDVWFSITVPASGNVYITPEPNLTTAGYLTNPAMALYTGSSCSSLTQYTCSNNYTTYPGSSNDLLPYIKATGLTPGSVVYLRYWGTAATQGTFGICVQSPTNDDCANAIYVCDINGYSASTSGAYTPDRPGSGTSQMKGNNENSSGTNLTDGTNSGGVFGYYPPSNVAGPYSSPAIDVNIENNSWIRFTAANATANLRVTVGSCWVGGYPSGGIQMQIFSSTGCANFSPKSSFKEGSSTFTVTGFGLTVGSDYYLMVDGYANDICNYTIQALDGVAFPEIKALPDSICIGQTSILTAPAGASAYLWSPGGQTTQTISVTPGSTQTFTCIASGVCGYKQTLTKTVYLKASPTVLINSGSPISTCGTQTLTLTGSGASTYTWSTGATTSTISVTNSTTTTYTLLGRAANTCTNNTVATVTVNPVPNVLLAGTNTICAGNSTILSASGATSYTWTPGNSHATSISITPTVTTGYTVTGSNSYGCTKTATTLVTVNSIPQLVSTPSITPSNCGASTGAITNVTVTGTPALTYTWSNGTTNVGFTPNIISQPAGTYNLFVKDGNNCTNNFGPYIISNPGAPAAPTASALANSICSGQTINLYANSATSGVTYNWSGPSSYTSSAQYPVINNANASMSGVYSVYVTLAGCNSPITIVTVTVNPTPSIVLAGTNTICAGSPTTLSASGGTSYTWTPGGSNSASISVSPTATTGYTVTGAHSSGCSNTASITVTVNSLPQLVSTPSVVPSNCGASTGAITNVTVTGVPVLTYTWSNGGGTNVGYTPNITGQPAGIYNLFVMDGNNCSNTFGPYNIFNPGAPAAPTASALANSICLGQSIDLFANSSSGGSYSWSGPASYTTSIQNPVIPNATINMSGVYSVYVTLSGCSSPATNVTVTVNLPPIASAPLSQNVFCEGNTINLVGSGGGFYAWTGPNNFSSTSQNPQINNAQVNASGFYSLTVTDAVTTCTASTTVSVTVNSNPVLSTFSGDTTCIGGQLSLFADFGPGVDVTWYSDAALTNTVQTNSSFFNPPLVTDGVYTFYAQGSLNGCSSPIATVTASFHNIRAVASADIYTGNAPLNVVFTGSNSIGVTPTDNFNWNFGDNTATTSTINPNHLFNDGGTFTVVLTVSDVESGCMDTATIVIKVDGDLVVIVPNVFTPNGDDKNDLFHIDIRGAKSAEGFIYNRWGQLLFSWDAINASWDGKASNGEDCPDATYYYLIKVIDKKDKEHLFPGYALIIR